MKTGWGGTIAFRGCIRGAIERQGLGGSLCLGLLYAGFRSPLPHFPSNLSLEQQVTAAAVGVVVLGGVLWLVLRRKRPTPEEIERARREWLVRVGRITDGSLLDSGVVDESVPENGAPGWLVFTYQIAGVVYEASQDVSTLPEKVKDMRFDLPVQVRYDYQNPANSIVVAEEWSGVRLRG